MHSGEGGEPNHVLGGRFHGLEWILGTTCEFSCGPKSTGKVTGLEEEDDDASIPQWPIHNSRVFIFCFSILIHYPILLLLFNMLTDEA